jgi:hypothetical protein
MPHQSSFDYRFATDRYCPISGGCLLSIATGRLFERGGAE